MKIAVRRAILKKQIRTIRRELDNLEVLKAASRLGVAWRPESDEVTESMRDRENHLRQDLDRLGRMVLEQYA